MDATTEEDRPRRGRPPRAEAEAGHRRRRGGVLDVMRHDRLNPFEEGMLDHETFVYRWQTDEAGQIRALTVRDDYEFVMADEIPGFDISQTDSESDGRIRLIMNGAQAGPNAVYGYLLKKRRDFWEEDRLQISDFYEGMMEGRVYNAEATHSDEQRPGGAENFYAPKTNQLGSVSGTRRRGPVPRSLK